jgi:hypothetical protein
VNWKRGLRRLWIALSIGWIAMTALIFWDDIRRAYAPVIFSYADMHIEFPARTEAEVIRKVLVGAIEQERGKQPAARGVTIRKAPRTRPPR